MGAGKGKNQRMRAELVANRQRNINTNAYKNEKDRTNQGKYIDNHIKIISGHDLGPQLHTVLDPTRTAPQARFYKSAEDARDPTACIPDGGFWTENYMDDRYSFWADYRSGKSYRLMPRLETKILVVNTIKKAERLFKKYPTKSDVQGVDDNPFTVSFESLRLKGIDGIWVHTNVASQTPIFDGWDGDSVFWFSEKWPFIDEVKHVTL